jgi:hypothetical protein
VISRLEELTLDEIESEMAVEARDMDLESELESGYGASAINHQSEGCWIKCPQKRPKKQTGKFLKKKGFKKGGDKSEVADAAMHEVYSVMLELDRKIESLTPVHPLI